MMSDEPMPQVNARINDRLLWYSSIHITIRYPLNSTESSSSNKILLESTQELFLLCWGLVCTVAKLG